MRWEQSLLGVEGPKEGLKMNLTSMIWGKARVSFYRYASILQYYGLFFVNTHQGRAKFGEGTIFLSARCGLWGLFFFFYFFFFLQQIPPGSTGSLPLRPPP